MNGWRRLALTGAIATLSAVEPALAEAPGQWTTCIKSVAPSRDLQIAACTAAIRARHPDNAELAAAYYNRGHAYAEKSQPARALADFERALQLKPSYADALLGRGEILAQKNKWRQAVWDYDRALRLKPDFADAYVDRAIAFDTLHEYRRAIADFDQALKLRPNDSWLEFLRDGAKLANGDVGAHDAIARAKDPSEKLPTGPNP
jgi:tetratricopeptide (TPR) repeat protein